MGKWRTEDIWGCCFSTTLAASVLYLLVAAGVFAQAPKPKPQVNQKGAVKGQTKVPGKNLKAVINTTGSPPINGHSVTLNCTASTSPGVTGYNFYSGATKGGESTTPLNSTPAATCTWIDGSVIGTNTYWYVAKAYCPTCNPTLSIASNEIGPIVIPADAAPLPPTGLTATGIATNHVPLFWNAPSPQSGYTVTSYQVFRGPTPTLPSPIKIATVTGTSYTDNAACATGKTCYYEIKARDTHLGRIVISPPSNIVKVVMP